MLPSRCYPSLFDRSLCIGKKRVRKGAVLSAFLSLRPGPFRDDCRDLIARDTQIGKLVIVHRVQLFDLAFFLGLSSKHFEDRVQHRSISLRLRVLI